MDHYFYGQMKDMEELKLSASGGFAASIEKNTIRKGGIVYGAAYTSDFKGAEYIRIDAEGELYRLYGSKYIAADNKGMLGGGIIQDLLSGKIVTVIGVPCDIARVKAKLNSRHIRTDGCLMVDLVCGGVTMAEVAEQYIEKLESTYKSKVLEFSVRYKNPNWVPPYIRAVFENGKIFCKRFYSTEYGYAFEHLKKPMCYACRFKDENHPSDITIGDCWGIEADDPGYNALGVSLAVVHSAKGMKILSELKDISLYEDVDGDMVRGNPRYFTPRIKTSGDKQFEADFMDFGLHKACRRAWGLKGCFVNSLPEEMLAYLRMLKHKIGR